MSDLGDVSDSSASEKRDDKDEDFNIEDYQDEIASNDSYEDIPESDANKKDSTDEQVMDEDYRPVDSTCTGGHYFYRKFICVRYPGNVVNADKAIEKLGGICSISTAVNTPSRRLELRFRPNDGYSKPACGDKHITAGFLLRVRVKKSRIRKMEENEANKSQSGTKFVDCSSTRIDEGMVDIMEQINISHSDNNNRDTMSDLMKRVEDCNVNSSKDLTECSRKDETDVLRDTSNALEKNENVFNCKKNLRPTFERGRYEDLSEDSDYELPKLKVLGRVDIEFKFTSLCDFQYLPLTKKKNDPNVLECIYDSIFPVGIPQYSWLKSEVPYFLPPAAFSRIGSMQQYVPKTEITSQPGNIISKNKKRRTGFFNFINFTTPGVPCTAPAGIETAMKVKFLLTSHLEQIRKMFEERPVWSKNAIMYETKFTLEQLKILLPSVAYYFMTGPWRVMWVRLGYDPRQDISARKYQTLDYRLKAMHGLGSTVKCKRNYADYTLPYRSTPAAKQKPSIITPTLSQGQNRKKEDTKNDSVYIYREGIVPPSRQMFYQYCDIYVDEIQEMLAKLPDPLPGTKCHEKRGWLPSGFDVQCREIINKQVRTVLRKKLNIPVDHPTSLPRKRKYCMMRRLLKFKGKQSAKESVKKQPKSSMEVPEMSEQDFIDECTPGTSMQED